jgi:glycosyltransferase involved in cell wall biosynthesis
VEAPAISEGAASGKPFPRCLAIVPAFQERDAIAQVIADIRREAPVEIVVIDDGSGDGTAAEAVRAGARVITLPFNLGIGSAVQTGYMAAQEGDFDVAIQVDGDGQHPAAEIGRLVQGLTDSGADLAIGSRFLGERVYKAPWGRRLGIAVFARVVSAICRTKVTDTTSGFRAGNRRAIALFAAAYPHDYPEVEAVIIAHRAGLRIIEVPVQMRERQGGRSSITPVRSAYYMVKVLMAVGMLMLRRPVKLPEGQ